MDWNRLYRLSCGIQHYDWGERGVDGTPPFIADLLGIEANGRPYAELWMGDHPALPARMADLAGHPTLRHVIQRHPRAILGSLADGCDAPALPFLMKVLSCRQPLSIQAHPDRRRAAELHRRDPVHYPDASHKPEIAVALSGLEALVSFRRHAAIQADLAARTPLRDFFAEVKHTHGADWLRRAYAYIFSAPEDRLQTAVRDQRENARERAARSDHDRVFLTCSALYADGRGALSVYFLNFVRLRAGEALFIPPNEPHAYLDVTILECMAASDNVVRAGLTRKFVDRDVLLDMLTYAEGPPAIYSGQHAGPGATRYDVPAPEFEVMFHTVRDVQRLHAARGASIVLILEGRARFSLDGWSTQAERGSVWLVPAAAGGGEMHPVNGTARLVRAYTPPRAGVSSTAT